jgi:hypothetical protein
VRHIRDSLRYHVIHSSFFLSSVVFN